MMDAIENQRAHAAFEARDRSADGTFVAAVTTTGIYCRPSCPARRPRPENVRFFANATAARAEGFRPCLRCRPDDVGRDAVAVARATALLQGDDPPDLEALSRAVGYAPHHFQRLFSRHTGHSPARYVRALRLTRARQALSAGASVTEAIYDAGYASPSGFYRDASAALGMTPSAWRRGGKGVDIHWITAETAVGPVFLAVTDKGICRLSFGEGEGHLARRFPNARLIAQGHLARALLPRVIEACEQPREQTNLPLDIDGTAFQQAVWRELRRIPAGETRTYAEIARAVGRPGAVRATGSANAANSVAVLIPCHRVIRSDGTLGGYAYGAEIKRSLLEREKRQDERLVGSDAE